MTGIGEPKWDKLNVLVAYPYAKRRLVDLLVSRQDEVRLVMDSGAFTAWKAGSPIALDDYCRFIESFPAPLWRYFTLDVIGDPEGTARNYETMLARGFKPVPIFTRGEDPSHVDRLYETSDLIGVGGLVGTRGNKGFVNGIMQRIGSRKVHWLGFTQLDFIKRYRPFMCDASSWASGLQYGITRVWNPRGGWHVVTKLDMAGAPSLELRRLLQRYDIAPEELAVAKNWVNTSKGTSPTERLGFRSFVRMQMDVQDNLGTKVFMALVDQSQLAIALDAVAYWRERKR